MAIDQVIHRRFTSFDNHHILLNIVPKKLQWYVVNWCVTYVVSRVKSLLDSTSGKVAAGGKTDADINYISPTLLVDVALTDAVMKDEVWYAVNSTPVYHETFAT